MTTNPWLSSAVYPSLALLPSLITQFNIHPGIVLTLKDEAAFYLPYPSATLLLAIPTGLLWSLDPIFLPLNPVRLLGPMQWKFHLLFICEVSLPFLYFPGNWGSIDSCSTPMALSFAFFSELFSPTAFPWSSCLCLNTTCTSSSVFSGRKYHL